MRKFKITVLALCMFFVANAIYAQEQVKPSYIEILPYKVELRPGATQQFDVKFYTAEGEELSSVPHEWIAEGGGEVTQTGLYTAGTKEGTYQVAVCYPRTGMRMSALIFINDEDPKTDAHLTAPSRLVFQPQDITTPVKGTVQFRVEVFNLYSLKLKAPVKWEATGGTIDSEGLYTAGDTPGTFDVTVSTDNGVKGGTKVTVKDPKEMGALITVEWWDLHVGYMGNLIVKGDVYGENADTLEVYACPKECPDKISKIASASVRDGSPYEIETSFKAIFKHYAFELRLLDKEGKVITIFKKE